MATQFDATARINLDIRSFAQGAAAVTKTGGQMEKVFQNLNSVLGKVALVESDLAAKLRTSLAVYSQITTATRNYATAVAALQKNEASGAKGAELMAAAFQQLRGALAQVQGLSEKEFARVSRTVALYEKLASVINQLASAQRQMSTITQNAINSQQKEEQSKRKAEEASRRLTLAEQTLAVQQEKLAQSAARIAQEEQRLTQSRQRLASATQSATQGNASFSSSTFAMRSSIGELEGAFQSLFSVVAKVPTALAGAAISQEKAFAQVTRVVGEADAATAGLLGRFQEIAQRAPISFEEVARIGQLGAAIGISAGNLGDFTDTIVKFSLTTGTASEEATLLLGRIAQMENVPVSEVDQLASAVLALGTASAATDPEILRVNASIATVANLFGLTAQQTAGLSAALATLQVRPELSRGALTRVFNDLGSAVSNGGVELKKLATIMGMTDDEVTKLFQNPATRGDFLLSFINGLSRAAGAGGDVQGVLRQLGINAVRDIDVFSRLANNADVVRESFDRANVEFARGSELNRQSKGIYNTTASELQNLSDAFGTLLATLGGPFGAAIGAIASALSSVIERVSKLGPIVPIFGTLAAVVVTGGAAWLIYQVALAKTIQSLIAAKELQKNLQVNTLTLKTAYDIYRGTLGEASAAQTVAANTTRELNLTTSGLARSLAQSEVGMRAYAAAAASSAAGVNAMSAANVAASRSMTTMFNAAASSRGVLMQLNSAGAATALSMTGVSNANRALVLTQSQLGSSVRASAGQMTLLSASASGLNTATLRTTPALTGMSAAMQRAASAGAALGSGLGSTVNAGTTAASAFTRVGGAATQAGIAARAAAFAFGPWGIALTTIGILIGPLISDMISFQGASEALAASALEATGGTTALANAIKADTDVYNATHQAIRLVTVATDEMDATQRKAAESTRAEAQEKIRAIEATKGSISELQEQAAGHGAAAEAAQRYLREIGKEQATVDAVTASLQKSNVAIGENARQWILDTGEAVISQSKIADGSKTSAAALELLAKSGINVGSVLKQALADPKTSLDSLDAAFKGLDAQASQFANKGVPSNLADKINAEADAARRAQAVIGALKKVIESEDSATTKSAITKKLLKDALDGVGESAVAGSKNIKLDKAALEDLDTTADAVKQTMDELAGEFGKFGSPLDAFKNAAKSAFGDAEDAMSKFSLKSKGGLDAYLAELDKIAKAQRDWASNLIKISTTLGPDIAEQFRKLGPEAAPAVAQLADLSAKELEKLGPRLREIGSGATAELAASIIQNSGKIEKAGLQTRTVIADVFGKMIDKAKTAEDFAAVSNQYKTLVDAINKSPVAIEISADNAKAFHSLGDLSTYVDLVSSKTVKPEVAIDIIKAQTDITKLQALITSIEASGTLDATGKAKLDTLLFQNKVNELARQSAALSAEGKLDLKGEGKLSDSEYRTKVLALTQFLATQEGAALFDPQGEAQLNDAEYRAQMQSLATLILGEEAAGKFDVDGDGKLSTTEFKALLEALKGAVADANKGKLDPKGHVTLTGVGDFNNQLSGIVSAAYTAGGRITNALSRTATVSVGYYYYQKNSPPTTAQAANGGWINGPGGPKADVIPAMLSNGEFVVNAASAKRYGALLETINRAGGRGFSGAAKKLMDSTGTGGSKQVQVRASGGNSLRGPGMVQQVPPESVSVLAARLATPQSGPATVFHIYNQYPQAEPTSVTINRSLAYAASVGGV